MPDELLVPLLQRSGPLDIFLVELMDISRCHIWYNFLILTYQNSINPLCIFASLQVPSNLPQRWISMVPTLHRFTVRSANIVIVKVSWWESLSSALPNSTEEYPGNSFAICLPITFAYLPKSTLFFSLLDVSLEINLAPIGRHCRVLMGLGMNKQKSLYVQLDFSCTR